MLNRIHFSLRWKLTATLGLMALLTVLSTGYLAIKHSYQSLKHQKQQDELVMARNVAAQVDEVLAKARQAVETLANYPSIQSMNSWTQQEAMTLVAKVTELLDGLVVWDLNGRVIIFDQTEPDTQRLFPESPYEQFILPVKNSGAAQFSEVYRSKMGDVAVAINAPIYKDGQIAGVLSGGILLKNHSMGGIEGIRIGKSGYAYIVDNEGNIIVHPQRERLLENLSDHPPVKELSKKREGVVEFLNQEGIKVLAAFAPIKEAGWGVVVRQPTSESYAYAEQMQRFLVWIFILSLACSLGLGAFLAWRMSKPIVALAKGVRQVAEGRLDVKISVSVKDEIGELANAFNEMTSQLRRHREKSEQSHQKVLEAQKQLAHSEKMAGIGQLAAGLAHEIYNPLNVISGFADYLLENTPPEDSRRSPLQDIAQETSRCQKLVANILDFAKPKEPERHSSDLNQLVNETLGLVQSQAKTRKISIETNLKAIPTLELDRDQIKQVLLNLFLNACQAMPEGGQLTVETRRSNGHVEIAVSDTGAGIPSENLDSVFNPFFTTKTDGTGLGLALSYSIIEQHGGRIHVDSQPGRGAVFTIEIPAQEEIHDQSA